MARRTFGATWWGAAWLDALEQRALEDPNRLPRGRTYARQDRVTDVELSPGLVQARVWGTERYHTQMSVRVLSEQEWEQVLDTIMSKAANAAALLAGEVPADLGPLVLPGRGDLGPDCSCPDWAEPCKHVAALCYVLADVFDEDPFALLALRGRGRNEILTEVRKRRSAALGGVDANVSDLPRGADPGTAAAAAFKRDRAESVATRALPRHPIDRYRLGVAAPADGGIEIDELDALVGDAAARAWAMLAEGAPSGLDASAADDVVRRAARSTRNERVGMADATGLDPVDLEAAAAAWRGGGRAGYRASRDRWEPNPGAMAPGAQVLGGAAKIRGNRVSAGPRQLRLDPDGRWWRFDADDELGWVLTGGPVADPAEL
ncbi:MAG: SWIM zinc finger family protein [Actinomycetota bacterium]